MMIHLPGKIMISYIRGIARPTFLEKMLRAGLLNNSSGSFTLEEMVLGRVYPFSFDGMSRYVFVGTPAACIYYFYYYLRIIYSTEPKNWKMNPSKSASSLLQSLESVEIPTPEMILFKKYFKQRVRDTHWHHPVDRPTSSRLKDITWASISIKHKNISPANVLAVGNPSSSAKMVTRWSESHESLGVIRRKRQDN